jgi:HrpA-like RNA helicase
VAETSITIPGVSYVVDTGLAKEKEYHSSVGSFRLFSSTRCDASHPGYRWTGIDSLVTEKISRSSAQQRAGRAGRDVRIPFLAFSAAN